MLSKVYEMVPGYVSVTVLSQKSRIILLKRIKINAKRVLSKHMLYVFSSPLLIVDSILT